MTSVHDYLLSKTEVIKVSSGGAEIRIECPYCAGKTLDVNSSRGVWHCWGCQESGSFKSLQEKLGSVEKVEFVEVDSDVLEESEIDIDPSEIFSYQVKLRDHESLMKWLGEIKGLNESTIVKYQIGWDGKSIVFPIRNQAGKYVNIKFRSDPTRPGSSKSVWSKRGSHAALFNSEVIAGAKQVIICEGEWDAMLLTQLGYAAVTGTAGAMGWRERFCLSFSADQEIFICYDQEALEVGDRGMKKTQEMFNKYGIHTNIVKLPRTLEEKVDISDYLLKGGHGQEDFDKLLAGSVVIDEIEMKRKQIKEYSKAMTDVGNAYKIVDLYGDKIRYDVMRGRWLMWRGHRWVPDLDGGTARFYAIKMARHYQKLAVDMDGDEKKAAMKYALGLENKNKIVNEIELLKVIEPVRNDGLGWDANNWLLGCENGVVELESGEVRSGRPTDMITMSCRVEYDKGADCPMWIKFLDEIFQGDKDIIHYIHKALGYSLTGVTTSQAVFICHGVGANGKSVLFKTVADILGDYAHNAPTSLFQKNKYSNAGAATPEVAATEFKRFVVSSETLSEGALNEERLKKWTGGDKENARYLHDNGHEFEVTMKPWLFVNHQPKADDESNGFWRRVKMIPFERVFRASEQDPKLVEKLLTERQGIFNWLIEGCLMWQKEGLYPEPNKITVATQEYKEENNRLADYISDRIIISEGDRTLSKEIWQDFVEWKREEGIEKGYQRDGFFKEFGKSFKKGRSKHSRFHIGLLLKSGKGVLPKQEDFLGDSGKPEVVTGMTPFSTFSLIRGQQPSINLENDPSAVTPSGDRLSPTPENGNFDDQNPTENEIKELFGIKD